MTTKIKEVLNNQLPTVIDQIPSCRHEWDETIDNLLRMICQIEERRSRSTANSLSSQIAAISSNYIRASLPSSINYPKEQKGLSTIYSFGRNSR